MKNYWIIENDGVLECSSNRTLIMAAFGSKPKKIRAISADAARREYKRRRRTNSI